MYFESPKSRAKVLAYFTKLPKPRKSKPDNTVVVCTIAITEMANEMKETTNLLQN